MFTLYTKDRWDAYCQKVESDFQLKTYPQFDPYFNFPKDKGLLRRMVSDPTLSQVANHDFIPFLKILQKTPRYKDQTGEGDFELETKIRPISFASHFDTYLYGFYAYALNEEYQKYIHNAKFNEAILAYRTDLGGKCNIQFAKEVFDLIREKFNKEGECSVIALDIKGYFDNINHQVLKKMWCKVLGLSKLPQDQYKIFRSLTKYSYVNYTSFLKNFDINLKKLKSIHKINHENKNNITLKYQSLLDLIPDELAGPKFGDKIELLRTRKLITINSVFDKDKKSRVLKKSGIPQGSSMSAVLSNIYLLEFDRLIFEKGVKEGFIYRRYCDDLLVICNPNQVDEINDYIMNLIDIEYCLTIQEKKTEIIDFKLSSSKKIRAYRRKYLSESKRFISLSNDNKNFKNLQYLGFEFNGQNVYIRPSSLSRYFRKMKARIVKTVSMAYSKNSKSSIINKEQIYSRYTHFGKRNFVAYAINASKAYYTNSAGEKKHGFDSHSIRRQIAAHMRILKQEITKTSEQWAKNKGVKEIKT